jgi:hypothetical protein
MVDREVLAFVTEKTREMTAAPSCCHEAKAAAQAWLDAVGTEREAAETRKYIAELEEDIEPIDGLIEFAASDAAVAHFGQAGAQNLLAHARSIKAAGATHCDCPACSAAAAILAKKRQML